SAERHTRLGAVHVLAALAAEADNPLAASARHALERLAQDDSRLVSEAATEVLAGIGPLSDTTADRREAVAGGSDGKRNVVPAQGTFAEPPVWEQDPRLIGEPRLGQPLSLDKPRLRGEVRSFSYQWEREQRSTHRSHTIADARSDHYEPLLADVGCRLRANVTARGRFGQAVGTTQWSAPVQAEALPVAPSNAITRVRTASAVAVAGAIIVLGSLIPHNQYPELTRFWYRGIVAFISLGVIGLIGLALRLRRRAPLLGGTWLAFALLGVAFPMSWHATSAKLPTFAAFWIAVVGAAVAALAALAAAWAAYDALFQGTEVSLQEARLPDRRILLAMAGAVIAIASLFVLPEWKLHGLTTFQHWQKDPVVRYPATIILLSGVVIILSTAVIQRRRDHLLLGATAVASLLLGETVPLIYINIGGPWGPGRWLRIAAAALTVGCLTREISVSHRYGPLSGARVDQLDTTV
ncbi:MAG: hypothetical protein JO240_14730, partial [Solirubrobacterales bacterium]|nr:hypothetical protein [Solirubrobacterales bacterium]